MQEGDLIDGKYELLQLLGEGGMGAVYGAYHRLLGRKVALKFMLPEHVEKREYAARFLREAQAAAAIGSEHIIDVTDVGETQDGCPYLVMEYLEGEDLDKILGREGSLAPTRAVGLVLQACRALAAAHERGIVHRDLKPENLFRTFRDDGSEWIKVLDFGIAKVHDSFGDASTRLTATGTMLGTPMYMAPEQACGAKHIDERADIYALGSILYELLTGRPPFDGETYNEIIVKIATQDPLPPTALRPKLDPDLEAVIMTAIAKDPDERFGTVLELARALLPFGNSTGMTFPLQAVEPREKEAVVSAVSPTALSPAPQLSPGGDADKNVSGTAETVVVNEPKQAPEDDEPDDDRFEKATVVRPSYPPADSPTGKRRGFALSGGALAVVVVIVVTGVGLGFVISRRGSGGPETAVAELFDAATLEPHAVDLPLDAADGGEAMADAHIDSAAVGTVRISIRVEPSEARVRIDGIEVSGNPYVGRFPRDAAQHRVEARAEGYQVKALFVSFAEDGDVEIQLRPASAGGAKARPRIRRGGASEATPAKASGRPPVRRLDKNNPYGGG